MHHGIVSAVCKQVQSVDVGRLDIAYVVRVDKPCQWKGRNNGCSGSTSLFPCRNNTHDNGTDSALLRYYYTTFRP